MKLNVARLDDGKFSITDGENILKICPCCGLKLENELSAILVRNEIESDYSFSWEDALTEQKKYEGEK
jgi:hypothetical protein